ncbi:MAG: response regulator, partial [Campylobacteraceae bacterium]|nr:response regulator [Campylobacteraceae bacterium]
VTAEDRKKALDSGMNEHLAKPLQSKRLYELLGTLCERSNPISPTKVSQVHEPLSPKGAIDPHHVDVMFDGDVALFQKLLIHFGAQLDGEFKTIVEAVRGNHGDASVLVHTLKGVSGNLGALALADACSRIDICYKQKQAIDESLIQALQQHILEVKEALVSLELEEIVILSDDAILSTLMQFQKRLEEADLIEPFEQASLVKALAGKVDQKALKQWDEAIHALDYGKALRVMQDWSLILTREKVMG